MVEKDIYLSGFNKQNALFSENSPKKTHLCPQFLEYTLRPGPEMLVHAGATLVLSSFMTCKPNTLKETTLHKLTDS